MRNLRNAWLLIVFAKSTLQTFSASFLSTYANISTTSSKRIILDCFNSFPRRNKRASVVFLAWQPIEMWRWGHINVPDDFRRWYRGKRENGREACKPCCSSLEQRDWTLLFIGTLHHRCSFPQSRMYFCYLGFLLGKKVITFKRWLSRTFASD